MTSAALPALVRPLLAAALLLPALSVLRPAPLAAQDVELQGRGEADSDRYLKRLIESGAYTLFLEDTVVAAGDTIPGTALVMSARMRIDGVIAGDLVIVDADVFLRPGGEVLGDVRNLGAGFYPSDLAQVHGRTYSLPHRTYRYEQKPDGGVVLAGTRHRSTFVRYGLAGLLPPTYDRVDGVTVAISAGYLLPRIELFEPVVRWHAAYRSQRGAFTGGAEFAVPRRGTEVAVGAERTTWTNERWIKSDFGNSLDAFFLGKDRRDYFEVDRAFLELRRLLEEGDRTARAWTRVQVEDARPLRAGDPWSVFGSFRDDNITFPASRISSLQAGAELEWELPLHVVELTGSAELAGTPLSGEHSFAAFRIDGEWAMAALWNHTLEIEFYAQGPLPGTDSLPGQRWTFVGGSGTLNTYEMAEFRGDRATFIETGYLVPLPHRWSVPKLGQPVLELLHKAGMAWSDDERRRFAQNIGVRLRFSIVNVRLLTDPANPGEDLKLSIGLHAPRKYRPWELAW